MALIDAAIASLPALTNMQRRAFRDQWTTAQCDEAGVRVDAEEIALEAITWTPHIDAALSAAPHAIRRYSRARFAWLLECVRDLEEAIDAGRTGAGSPNAGRRRMDRARKTAFWMREELIEVLTVLSGGDEIERRAVEAASGTVDSPEALGSALRALARLAEAWLERESPGAKALVASVDLTSADVDAARAATHALAFAFSDASSDPRSDSHDGTVSHRAAGRVVLEMQLVMRIFERAHALYPQVPRLVPGTPTRAALAFDSVFPPPAPSPTGELPVTTREGATAAMLRRGA